MSCRKEKEEISKKRVNVKLKNQLNSDFIRQKILEKFSDDLRSIHDQDSPCTNNPIRIKLPIGIQKKMFINPNTENLCGITSTSISEDKLTSELVGLKYIDEKSEIKETQTLMTQLTDDFLECKILEIITKFKEKCIPFKEFLYLNVKNFLSLKESGVFDKLIRDYRREKGSNKLILSKGYHFTKPFKIWVNELDPSNFEVLGIIEKNFEILKYVVYFLLKGSENEANKISISELSNFIGVGAMMVRKTAILLGDLKVMDYTCNYGIESVNLRDVTKSTTGT